MLRLAAMCVPFLLLFACDDLQEYQSNDDMSQSAAFEIDGDTYKWRVTVSSVDSQIVDEQGPEIESYVTFEVLGHSSDTPSDMRSGSLDGNFRGGEVGDIGQVVGDTPVFHRGMDLNVFVQRDAVQDGALVITGFEIDRVEDDTAKQTSYVGQPIEVEIVAYGDPAWFACRAVIGTTTVHVDDGDQNKGVICSAMAAADHHNITMNVRTSTTSSGNRVVDYLSTYTDKTGQTVRRVDELGDGPNWVAGAGNPTVACMVTLSDYSKYWVDRENQKVPEVSMCDALYGAYASGENITLWYSPTYHQITKIKS